MRVIVISQFKRLETTHCYLSIVNTRTVKTRIPSWARLAPFAFRIPEDDSWTTTSLIWRFVYRGSNVLQMCHTFVTFHIYPFILTSICVRKNSWIASQYVKSFSLCKYDCFICIQRRHRFKRFRPHSTFSLPFVFLGSRKWDL